MNKFNDIYISDEIYRVNIIFFLQRIKNNIEKYRSNLA